MKALYTIIFLLEPLHVVESLDKLDLNKHLLDDEALASHMMETLNMEDTIDW